VNALTDQVCHAPVYKQLLPRRTRALQISFHWQESSRLADASFSWLRPKTTTFDKRLNLWAGRMAAFSRLRRMNVKLNVQLQEGALHHRGSSTFLKRSRASGGKSHSSLFTINEPHAINRCAVVEKYLTRSTTIFGPPDFSRTTSPFLHTWRLAGSPSRAVGFGLRAFLVVVPSIEKTNLDSLIEFS
jgi:hypothetical protein